MSLLFLLFACGGADDSPDGPADVQGEIRTEDAIEFPLRAGVLYTEETDGIDRIGLTSVASAGCNVADWWILADDWAYLLVDPAEASAEFHFGRQVPGGFEGGTEHLDAAVTLDVFEPTDGGMASGTATFADPFDDVHRGGATFTVSYCGVVSAN